MLRTETEGIMLYEGDRDKRKKTQFANGCGRRGVRGGVMKAVPLV